MPDLQGETTLRYSIEWDGQMVTLPPIGHPVINYGLPFHTFGGGYRRLTRYAAGRSNPASEGQTLTLVPVVLIPRPDNEDDPHAVSVARPRSTGGDIDDRHIGFLSRFLLSRLPDNAIPLLAEMSGGEVNCTAMFEHGDPKREAALALPKPYELAYAMQSFLIARGIDLDPVAPRPGSAVDDEGRQFTSHVLDRLRIFPEASRPLEELTVTVCTGKHGHSSSFTVWSGQTPIGSIAHGYLLLDDERLRPAVLDKLNALGVPAAPPREPGRDAVSSEWDSTVVPNVNADWRPIIGSDYSTPTPGGMKLRWVEPDGPSTKTKFAQYNPTTETLWVEDERLVAPACIFAARLGIPVYEIGLPPESWTLANTFGAGACEIIPMNDGFERFLKPRFRPLNPEVANLVPNELFEARELERIAQPTHKSGAEPTALLERMTVHRVTLFPDHVYLDTIGICRICERPGGEFRTSFCAETLTYCHRCLAWAVEGLPNGVGPVSVKRVISRATLAVRSLADDEFGGAAFVESQLLTMHAGPRLPALSSDIDRRLLLRMAITRGQLPWTRILIDAGLADDGVRLSRGTVLNAADGHLCSSMLEKAVDDFFHLQGIGHTREPLYPFDEQLNPNTRRRADWLIEDGTFVEMWGMPNDSVYADKMREKIELAQRHGLALIGLMPNDVGRLNEIFAHLARK